MDAVQNLISILRANNWGVAFSGSWADDETTLHRWGVVTPQGATLDPSAAGVPDETVRIFARCLYNTYDADGEGLSGAWFPNMEATSWFAEVIDKPIEELTWDDVMGIAYS